MKTRGKIIQAFILSWVIIFSLAFATASSAETDISDKIQLEKSRLRFDRRTNTNYLDVAVKNISEAILLTPIKVVIDSISSSDVTVNNADGVTDDGKPYFSFSSENFLNPSKATSSKRWIFNNPNRLRFSYTTKIVGGFVKIPLTTKVIDETLSSFIQDVSPDGVTYTFDNSLHQQLTLQVGDILIFGVTPFTHHGALRKIVEINTAGDTVTALTVQASLAESIENCHIEIKQTISPGDVISANLMDGVTFTHKSPFEFTLVDVLIYDSDGDESTETDQIRVNGHLNLEHDYTLIIDIKWFELNYFHFLYTASEDSDLIVTAKGALSFNQNPDAEIADITLPSFPVPGTPIVVTPELEVHVGVTGQVNAIVETGFSQDGSLKAGVEYVNDDWSTISEFETGFEYYPPNVAANASVNAYAKPTLNLLIFGVAGPHAGVRGYLDFSADINNNPWWLLYAGLAVDVGVVAEIFDHNLVDIEFPGIIDYRKFIAQAELICSNCDFSSDTGERCLGGVGIKCKGAPGAGPITADCDTCVVSGWMSIGSILHDECCLENSDGWFCSINFSQWDKTKCKDEWDEAWNDTLFGLQWKWDFGPYPIGNIGDDTTQDFRGVAPPGAKIPTEVIIPGEAIIPEEYCLSGEFEVDENGDQIILTSGVFGLGKEYSVCSEPVDSDGDGVPDYMDEFPNDPNEWEDLDSDGIGDNSDVCHDTPIGDQVDANGCSASQRDFDGDGHEGSSGTGEDCDDSDSAIYPGATEECDGKDNQCPGDPGYGEIDEGCTPPPDGLIAHYTFEGDALDQVGNHHGTLIGDTSFAPGMIGQAASFDGYGDYIQVSPNFNAELSGSPYSVAAWVKVKAEPSFPQSNSASFFTNDVHCMPHRATVGTNTGVLKLGFATYRSCFNGEGVVTEDVKLDRWYHMTATLDETQLKLYVNGTLIDTANIGYPEVVPWNGSVKIGGNDRIGRYFTGKVDDLRLYNRALTEAEINKLAGVNLDSGLIAHWPFDNNANDIAGDNHGIEYGGLSYAPGIMGQAASFDGIDDWIEANIGVLQSIAVSLWFKAPYPENHYGRLFDYGDDKELTCTILGPHPTYIQNNIDGNVYLSSCPIQNVSSCNAIESISKLADNTWHHVYAEYDRVSNVQSLFIDGVFQGEVDIFADLDASTMKFGYGSAFNIPGDEVLLPETYLKGTIDEVRIYNRALTEAEIQELYNQAGLDIDDDNDGFTENQGDCNDSDPDIHPDATEVCDATDNNCDDVIDEYCGLRYKVTDLGVIGDGWHSAAMAINNSGVVAGYSTYKYPGGENHAFFHDGNTMQDIGALIDSPKTGRSEAYGLNNLGQMVGLYKVGGYNRPFIYDGSTVQDLGDIFDETYGAGYSGVARAINDHGDIIFNYHIWLPRVFVYDGVSLKEIAIGGFNQCGAWAINNSGYVVGGCRQSITLRNHAFLYNGIETINLGELMGDGELDHSYAYHINNLGQIVGYRKTYGGGYRAFLYDGSSPIDLGTLGGPTKAFGLNDKGQVVGESYKPSKGEYHAFLYKNGVMEDLNDLVSDWGNWDPNGYLRNAYEINEEGQIVGYGHTYNEDRRAFRLDPIMTNP